MYIVYVIKNLISLFICGYPALRLKVIRTTYPLIYIIYIYYFLIIKIKSKILYTIDIELVNAIDTF